MPAKDVDIKRKSIIKRFQNQSRGVIVLMQM